MFAPREERAARRFRTDPRMWLLFPHSHNAFTEGLVLDASNNVLFESTGLADVTGCCSTLRKVDMDTGRVLAYVNSSTDVLPKGSLCGRTK